MLDALLYILFVIVVLVTARWTVLFLIQALVSLVRVLVSLAGTVVLAGIFILILARFLPY